MSYTVVFESLQELFPQVDKRILKAASIEHANNLDTAVEFILQEVIPSIPEPVMSSENVEDNSNLYEAPPEGIFLMSSKNVGDNSNLYESPPEGLNTRTEEASSSIVSSILSSVQPNAAFQNGRYVIHPNESDLDNSQNLYNSIVNTTLPKGNIFNRQLHVNKGMPQSSSSKSRTWDLSVLVANKRASSQDEGPNVGMKEEEAEGSNRLNNQPVFESEVSTQSTHSVNAEVLQFFVSDAKSSKMSLSASVDKLFAMLKDVVYHEDNAKITKDEAFTAGQNTLNKVEELREMLFRAEEINNVRAGEVYGERSILSTEARELQSRLLSLSDEKNKSIELIEEIQQTLKARLAAAEDEIAKADNVRIEREESAQRALREQEEMLSVIVEESKKLQQEAEENMKLRDFLVERGRVVDSLQGEIAVLCEDISRLKEIVEGHLPMTKSILSTISSLASSSSSVSQNKSTIFLQRDVTVVDADEKIIMTEKETLDGDGSSPSNSHVDWALIE